MYTIVSLSKIKKYFMKHSLIWMFARKESIWKKVQFVIQRHEILISEQNNNNNNKIPRTVIICKGISSRLSYRF